MSRLTLRDADSDAFEDPPPPYTVEDPAENQAEARSPCSPNRHDLLVGCATVAAQARRCLALADYGNLQLAENAYRRAIDGCKKDKSQTNILLFLQERLVVLLDNLGDHAEATKLREDVFSQRLEMFEFHNPRKLKRGTLFYSTEQHNDDSKKSYVDRNEDDTDAFAYSNLLAIHAALYRDNGHPEAAVLLYRDALGLSLTFNVIFPAPYIACQKAELALAFLMLNRSAIAKDIATDAHDSLQQVLGPDHPDTLYSTLILALCERLQSDLFLDSPESEEKPGQQNYFTQHRATQPLKLAIKFFTGGLSEALESSRKGLIKHKFSDIVGTTTAEQMLFAAVTHNKSWLISELIERGVDVNARNDYYGTALQAAACAGHLQVVRTLLLDYHADINCTSGLFGTALRGALIHGHISVARFLVLKGADPNLRIAGTVHPVQVAVLMNDVGLVRVLLRSGQAHTNAKDYLFEDPLGEACAIGNLVLEDFFRAGADSGFSRKPDV